MCQGSSPERQEACSSLFILSAQRLYLLSSSHVPSIMRQPFQYSQGKHLNHLDPEEGEGKLVQFIAKLSRSLPARHGESGL